MYKEIFGFCVRRTGHSAMINWVGGQCEPVIWFADVSLKGEGYSLPAIIRLKKDKPADVQRFNRKILTRGMDGFGYKIEDSWNMRIFTFEDTTGNPFTVPWIIETVENLRTTENPIIIFTLRNPLDVQKSQAGFGIKYLERDEETVHLQNQRKWLTQDLFPHQTIGIEYENWCESEAYRRFISSCLGLTFSDNRRKEILSVTSFPTFKGDRGEVILSKRWK